MQIMRNIFTVLIGLNCCALIQAASPTNQKHSPILEWANVGNLDKIKQFQGISKTKGMPIDWNTLNELGQTPLILAAIKGHKNVVDFLLAQGVDRTIKDKSQKSAEDYAIEKKNDQILFLLLNTPDAYTGETLLTQAIKANAVEKVVNLIKRRATVHQPRADGIKPLFLALMLYENTKDKDTAHTIIIELIKNGAVTDLADAKTGKTVLHLAIEKNLPLEIITLIIDCTINLNAQDKEGNTPLHYASQMTNGQAIDYLYQEGADVSKVNHKKQTPRDIVGSKTKTNKLNQITAIQNTLDFYAKNSHSSPRTKKCVARSNKEQNDKDIKSAASAAGSTGTATQETPSAQQKTKFAQDRKQHESAALEQTNEQGQTLLTQAVAEGKLENVVKLIDIGAAINGYDDNGQTPLLVAVGNYSSQPKQDRSNYLKIIKKLLENKASISFVDLKTRKNPLHLAVENEEHPVVELLLSLINEKDADAVDAQDNNGDTPLHFAAAAGNPTMVDLLIKNKAQKSTLNHNGQKPFDVVGTKESVALMHSHKTATQKLIDAQDNKKKIKEMLSDEWDDTRQTRARTQSVFQAPQQAK